MSTAALTLAAASPPSSSAGAFTISHPLKQLCLHQLLYSGIHISLSACFMRLWGPSHSSPQSEFAPETFHLEGVLDRRKFLLGLW